MTELNYEDAHNKDIEALSKEADTINKKIHGYKEYNKTLSIKS